MRLISLMALAALIGAFAGIAATPAKKTPVKKAAPTAKAPAAKKKTGKAVKKAPAATWRNRQQNPTADRYREIQQALVDKGYLKSEPSGVWDSQSTEAMQRFQADQKLTANGRINAPSLIALGLGAKSAGAPEAPDAHPAETPQPAKTSDN